MSEPAKSDLLPLCLYEAVMSLYPAASDGTALRNRPVWWGAVANGLRLSLEYDEMLLMSSGDAYATAHHLDERHAVDVERTWLLPKATILANSPPNPGEPVDFVPQRNQRYLLELVWFSDGYWYRRSYFGVTGRSVGWDSVRTLQFGNRQAYRAQFYQEESGYSGSVPMSVFTPLPGTDEQSIGFFSEDAMVVGEYMLGHYRWPVAAALLSARAIAFAPQNAPMVLTLEVGGVLTDQTLTIPVGPVDTEVSATTALNYTVPAGQSVRWKITAGPAPEDAARLAALAMQVQPLA
jgi:hypothetical protein